MPWAKALHVGAGYCAGASGCKARNANGTACYRGRECATGFCVDGVCCDGPCNTAQCQACNLAGSKGACTAIVASTPARVVKIDAPRYDTVLTNSNSDGSSSLSQIRFRGKTFALEIAGEGGGAGAAGASR